MSAPSAGSAAATLRLADVLELIARDIEELDRRKGWLKAQMSEIVMATTDEEQLAEVYWRIEEVPTQTLAAAAGCPAHEFHKIAQRYLYWSWRCHNCDTEVFITTRTELKARLLGQRLGSRRGGARRGPDVLLCSRCRDESSPTNIGVLPVPPGAVPATRGQELATMPYREYLGTPEWQERRKAALKRAGHRCQVCNRNRMLHVHHRTYERRGAELAADLIVLCDECHALYHGKGLLAAGTEVIADAAQASSAP